MKEKFNNFIKTEIDTFLKKINFKKQNLTFIKKENDVFFVINFQKSNGSNWEAIPFYINYGVYLPKISKFTNDFKSIWDCQIWDRITPENPKEHSFLYNEATNEKLLSDFILNYFNNILLPFFNKNNSITNCIHSSIVENKIASDKELQVFEYLIRNNEIVKLANYLKRINNGWLESIENEPDNKIRFEILKHNYYNEFLINFGLEFDELIKGISKNCFQYF